MSASLHDYTSLIRPGFPGDDRHAMLIFYLEHTDRPFLATLQASGVYAFSHPTVTDHLSPWLAMDFVEDREAFVFGDDSIPLRDVRALWFGENCFKDHLLGTPTSGWQCAQDYRAMYRVCRDLWPEREDVPQRAWSLIARSESVITP